MSFLPPVPIDLRGGLRQVVEHKVADVEHVRVGPATSARSAIARIYVSQPSSDRPARVHTPRTMPFAIYRWLSERDLLILFHGDAAAVLDLMQIAPWRMTEIGEREWWVRVGGSR